MKTIKLSFINNLDRNLKSSKNLIQVILGPRQVGKTTTILDYLENEFQGKAHYVSADSTFNSSATWVREQWSLAVQQNKLLVIDEVQKCENWSDVIKSLWDEYKRKKINIKCVLLGSSSLEIQKGLTESLTGRFQLIYAFHWNFAESKKGYDLSIEEYLKYGGYPGSYEFRNQSEWQQYVKNSIVSTVIEKDILQFNKVKSPTLFRQAFEILTSYPAQEVSYTKLLGQLQDKGNVDLVKHYMKLYEGAFLIRILQKFSGNAIKLKSSSPKILLLAPSLYYLNILSEYSAEERGRVLELMVGAQLVRTGQELYYWREGKFEVDYILRIGRRLWAIEVKSSKKKNHLGLQSFKTKYPHCQSVVISFENYVEFEKDPLGFLEKV